MDTDYSLKKQRLNPFFNITKLTKQQIKTAVLESRQDTAQPIINEQRIDDALRWLITRQTTQLSNETANQQSANLILIKSQIMRSRQLTTIEKEQILNQIDSFKQTNLPDNIKQSPEHHLYQHYLNPNAKATIYSLLPVASIIGVSGIILASGVVAGISLVGFGIPLAIAGLGTAGYLAYRALKTHFLEKEVRLLKKHRSAYALASRESVIPTGAHSSDPDNLALISQNLKQLAKRAPDRFGHVQSQLERCAKWSKRFDQAVTVNAIALLAKDIHRAIATESHVVFNGGFVTKDIAHAVLFETIQNANDSYSFRIYNTGDGLSQFHPHRTDIGKNKFETMVEYSIPKENLTPEKLTQLLLNRFPNSDNMKRTPEEGLKAIYDWPASIGSKNTNSHVKAQTSQKIGNCWLKSQFAYLKQTLPDPDYQELRTTIFNDQRQFAELIGDHDLADLLQTKAQNSQNRHAIARFLTDLPFQ